MMYWLLPIEPRSARSCRNIRQVAAGVGVEAALSEHRQTQPTGRMRVAMFGDMTILLRQNMLATFVALNAVVSLAPDVSFLAGRFHRMRLMPRPGGERR
jgi:hypothetical protein